MSVEKKLAILRAVECSPLPKAKALTRLDVPVRTYYRWLRLFRLQGKDVGLVLSHQRPGRLFATNFGLASAEDDGRRSV